MMVPKVTIKMRWEIKLPGFHREHWCSLEARRAAAAAVSKASVKL